jgi:coenzyme F420-reducing hydrogenase alpha subunit
MLSVLADLAQGAAVPPPAVLSDGPGRGLSAVDTARGLLVHRATLDGGRVADWRIVAPTEWTFHPDGALARVPLGWPAGNRTALLRRARLLVTAMDPCVAHDVAIREMAHA